MEYKIDKKKGHVAIIYLKGRIAGEFQTIEIHDRIEDLIASKYYRIIFDLSQLEYINSSGLNFFLKILTKIRRFDGEVVLCSLNNLLHALLVTTKLNSFFTILPTVEEAMNYLKKEKTIS
jgi:anti-anti-sigma factor